MANVYIYSLCVCLCVQLVFGQFGFFPPRTERRFPSFGFRNLFPPNGIRNTLNNIFQPANPRNNPAYMYPVQNPNRPISNNEYDQNRPINNNEYDQNRPINNNEYDQSRPINNNEYDQSRPINNNEYDQSRPINNNEYDQSRPINNNEYDQSRPINNNEYDQSRPINNNEYDQSRPINNNEYDQSRPINNNEYVPTSRPNNVRFPNQDDNPNSNVNFVPPLNPNPADEGREGADGVNFGNRPTFATINNGNDESENKHGIPNVPPPGFPDTPPPGFTNAPPPGIPDAPPPEFTNAPPLDTTLAPLTPVPPSEARDINFGSAGIFHETCKTIDNGVGSCINIATCPVYLKLLKQATANAQAVQVLRKVQCGFEGNYPKVCCPLQTLPSDPPPSPTPAPTAAPTQAASTEGAASAKSLPTDDYIPRFPVPPECGLSNASFSRVVGGVDAKLGEFDWMALLGYKGRSGSPTRWLCGGSLVSSRHVLTAAHCIHNHENDLYVVRLGELDIAREDDGATPIDVLIKSKIKHEGYNPKAFSNDIGLLVLEQEVQFTDLIKPICLPLESELRARNFVDYNPFIAGWGDTEFRGPSATHLQVLQLPVVSNEFCAKAYSQYKAQVIDERVLCAGYKKGGKDACQGDSGGPLMQPIYYSQNLTTYFYQIGVVSYGKRCAEAGFPGVYSRVTHFMPWLQKHMLGTE